MRDGVFLSNLGVQGLGPVHSTVLGPHSGLHIEECVVHINVLPWVCGLQHQGDSHV